MLVVSLGSEFIENNGEDAKRYATMNEEERKQDCETKAFKRLAEKIKRRFPRMPIILLADSLYASEAVMNICREKLTNFKITKRNVEKIASMGRKRWKIENERFNRQKNWQGGL